jgi:hypothetical protein
VTYTAPAAALNAATNVLAVEGLPHPDKAAHDVMDAVTWRIAQDVVKMTDAALELVEAHDPSCLSLYDESDDDVCDCSWKTITAVVHQLKVKVGIVT